MNKPQLLNAAVFNIAIGFVWLFLWTFTAFGQDRKMAFFVMLTVMMTLCFSVGSTLLLINRFSKNVASDKERQGGRD